MEETQNIPYLKISFFRISRNEPRSVNTPYYFLSYEIVKEFFVDSYKEDDRHPKSEIVIEIMRAFERHYCVP